MSKKISKNLWIPQEVADEFDATVERLADAMPRKLETGEVGGAALVAFFRLSDADKMRVVRDYGNRLHDLAIQHLEVTAPVEDVAHDHNQEEFEKHLEMGRKARGQGRSKHNKTA